MNQGNHKSSNQPERSRISVRLLVYILSFSSIITLIGTSLQLYIDYRTDVSLIEHRLDVVEESYLKGLERSLWDMNDQQTRALGEGIASLPDVAFVSIATESGSVVFEKGRSGERRKLARTFEIVGRGGLVLGTLALEASLDGVIGRLKDKLLVILSTQAVKTFLVSFFILFVVHLLVTRHLARMAAFARGLTPDNLGTSFSLDRAPHQDELDEVADSLEQMRLGLLEHIERRRGVERELRQALRQLREHEAHLGEIVALRTEDLERSNRDLQQFAYVASHDLKEPLRIITSYLQLLERNLGSDLDPDSQQFIEFAVSSAKRMAVLIDDLLKFSRVGSRDTAFAEVDLAEVLQAATDNLRAPILESGAMVHWEGMPAIEGDRPQLESLFQNLIGNAIKYRHPERKPEVAVSCRRSGGDWVVSVRDNGIGIAPEYFEKIFVIFQRLHGRNEYEGTGIGLALCTRIVEHHGGTLRVESVPDEGSTFLVTLRARD